MNPKNVPTHVMDNSPHSHIKLENELTKEQNDYIMSNPKDCDDCSDIYNIEDLYKIDNEYKCKNCLEFK